MKRIILILVILGSIIFGSLWATGAFQGDDDGREGDADGYVEVEGIVYSTQQVPVPGAQVSCTNTHKTYADSEGYYLLKMPVGRRCQTNIPYEEDHYQIVAYHLDHGMVFVDILAFDEQIVWQDIEFEGPGGRDDPADGIARVYVRVLDLCTEERLDPGAWVKAGWVQGILKEGGWYALEFGYDGHTRISISAGAPNHLTSERSFGGVSDTQKLYIEMTLWSEADADRGYC